MVDHLTTIPSSVLSPKPLNLHPLLERRICAGLVWGFCHVASLDEESVRDGSCEECDGQKDVSNRNENPRNSFTNFHKSSDLQTYMFVGQLDAEEGPLRRR